MLKRLLIKCGVFFLVKHKYYCIFFSFVLLVVSCDIIFYFLLIYVKRIHGEGQKNKRVIELRQIYIYLFFFVRFGFGFLISFLDFSKMQTEKVIEYIVKWLTDYHQSSHTKGFAVGVSGGIDSAIVSTLCARTGLPVLVIEMPIRQSASEIQRSRAHINWLKSKFPNVTGAEVNLTEVFETFEKTVAKSEINEIIPYTEIALANTRSRLRMVRIFYLDLINDLFQIFFFQD